MVRLTLLARITDGLPLAEGLDDDQNNDLDQFKMQAKVFGSSGLLFPPDCQAILLVEQPVWLH